jgi:hypothetical protein
MPKYQDFNEALKKLGPHTPAALKDAWIKTHDTLEFAQIIAHSLFGADVSPEIALAVYDRMVARMNSAPPTESATSE